MVDVQDKPYQWRRATASGRLRCQAKTIQALRRQALPKGDVLTVAQVAGIQAVKRTADWIPLCHPLPIDHVELTFRLRAAAIEITCQVTTVARTGVEMEALTGVSAAALALYDMCKAVDRAMRIENVRVVEKVKR
jgi:cyclic pyranopterin phosphate synthase